MMGRSWGGEVRGSSHFVRIGAHEQRLGIHRTPAPSWNWLSTPEDWGLRQRRQDTEDSLQIGAVCLPHPRFVPFVTGILSFCPFA